MTIIEEAKKLVGVPFKPQGRNESGLDCLGLILRAYQKCGIEVPSRGNYNIGLENYSESLIHYSSMSHDRIDSIDDVQDGDVLVFSNKPQEPPKHFGFCSNSGKGFEDLIVIHTTSQLGKVVEEQLEQRWFPLLHSIWRLKKEWQA